MPACGQAGRLAAGYAARDRAVRSRALGLHHRRNSPPGAVAAESLTQRFVAEAWAECGITVEPVLREGDLKPQLRKLLEQDASIKLVVLASAAGPGGPGPLVKQLGRSARFWRARRAGAGGAGRVETRRGARARHAGGGGGAGRRRGQLDRPRARGHLKRMFIQTEIDAKSAHAKVSARPRRAGRWKPRFADAEAGRASPLAKRCSRLTGSSASIWAATFSPSPRPKRSSGRI